MSDTRLQLLLEAATVAESELRHYLNGLIAAHVPAHLEPIIDNIPEREVRSDARRQERMLRRLSSALGCYGVDTLRHCLKCGATGGKHYGNCPAATAATTITGPGE